MLSKPPLDQGLYEARREHGSCGIGAVVRVSGRPGRDIVDMARQVLENLQHRGAAGADETTGDGAGILLQLPHEFLAAETRRLGIALPDPGRYGVGMVFSPREEGLRKGCRREFEAAAEVLGLRVLGWRNVPVRSECLGPAARSGEPRIDQVFVDGGGRTGEELERLLFRARRRVETRLLRQGGAAGEEFYVASLSSRTLVYKGMFLARQLFTYYPDLTDERVTSALAVVHQRYSTNTFPNWKLAQPFRLIAHNGEFNTLSGNVHKIRARERNMACPALGGDLSDLFPLLAPGASDSMCFDNVLELLVRAGRSLPHALMMMIPEAFGRHYHISTDKRAFYEYHAALMEPWDGPAAVLFTDGRLVGGTLDRNGLRPVRYVVTEDDLVILGSEAGAVEIAPQKIVQKGRLRPGFMFLVDTEEGRILPDSEIKGSISRRRPYRRWLEENRIEMRGLHQGRPSIPRDPEAILRDLRAFGYTREELRLILAPMAMHAQEPVGSMGTDTPLAVLSERPRLLSDYFKQHFAQVTNPPIDPLREGLVMSLMTFVGRQRNLLEETPAHCRQLKLSHPILTDDDLQILRDCPRKDFRVVTIPAFFPTGAADPGADLAAALDRLVEAGARAIGEEGASLLIVSDRGATEELAPIPILLAVGALHHGLLEHGLRGEAGIVAETGEAREVMQFCLLLGLGANAVNPYLALEVLQEMRRQGEIPADLEPRQIQDHYLTAVTKGILKTMSKMGISTLRSYQGAQLFEAVGLGREVVDRCFRGLTSAVGGVGFREIAAEALRRHRAAWHPPGPAELPLEVGGEYLYRAGGERHLWNPRTVALLQHAVRNGDARAYAEYAEAVNDQSRVLYTLRGLLEFVPGTPVPLEEVEPASEIVRRFVTAAMSHGSISREAHETLALAMNRLGGMSNTGEGGEDPARYVPLPGGDSLNCRIKQVASGRFGVTLEYLAHADVLQIKMAQGAKPGEGGQLPGHKVTDEIARLRHSTPGVTLISPPPHHDIYSIEDLAQLIYDLRCANPGARISVKLVAEAGVGTVAAGVVKAGADEVLISGHDGGTGASPLSSIKHAGTPWELGLAETQQTLVLNGLRDRVHLQVDGQLRTGRDVVVAALLGAERFGFGTAALVSLGCVLLRKCHLGLCPAGIGTQDPRLRQRFQGRPEHVQRFLLFVAEEARRIMAGLGFRTFDEMVGRVERLRVRRGLEGKAGRLDLSALLVCPDPSGEAPRRFRRPPPDALRGHLDRRLLAEAAPALERGEPVRFKGEIRNTHRTVGALLSHHVYRKAGVRGLPDGTLEITLRGSAGQSFGAFLAPGVTLRLVGEANDYVGKGLSGGRIVLQVPPGSRFPPHENVIAGNAVLYGATAGEAFLNGLAGERFAVRNSGALAVVEGVGDHGCEYMTGGVVVVLGPTGRNFAAGMSGGIAYVFDEQHLFDTLCNLDTVDLESVWQEEDRSRLRDLIERHVRWTGSTRGREILDDWHHRIGRFIKVMPLDYRRALERLREQERRAAEFTPATEEVFVHG